MAWQIGVDVGGTFTDLLALDPECGVFRVAKVLSTPEDQSIGFIAGLAELETDLAVVAALVHGTTVATNAVLERKGHIHAFLQPRGSASDQLPPRQTYPERTRHEVARLVHLLRLP
jgi:N-methylhydantoinase A